MLPLSANFSYAGKTRFLKGMMIFQANIPPWIQIDLIMLEIDQIVKEMGDIMIEVEQIMLKVTQMIIKIIFWALF